MWRISWVAANRLVSQGGIWFMEWVGWRDFAVTRRERLEEALRVTVRRDSKLRVFHPVVYTYSGIFYWTVVRKHCCPIKYTVIRAHNRVENPQFRIHASQEHSINQYKKWKIMVLKCNADIFFNKKCLAEKITPPYAKFKFPTTSPAATKTQNKSFGSWLVPIRFLCKEKYKIN